MSCHWHLCKFIWILSRVDSFFNRISKIKSPDRIGENRAHSSNHIIVFSVRLIQHLNRLPRAAVSFLKKMSSLWRHNWTLSHNNFHHINSVAKLVWLNCRLIMMSLLYQDIRSSSSACYACFNYLLPPSTTLNSIVERAVIVSTVRTHYSFPLSLNRIQASVVLIQ